MAEQRINLSPRWWLATILAVIAITGITMLLDVPVLRQISGIVFLTFIPGLLFLYILRLNKLGFLEKTVLSMGLSFAFIILLGLTVNGLLLAIGYRQPLSTVSIMISFSLTTVILAVVAYIRNRHTVFSLPNFRLTAREKVFLVVPSVLPLTGIVGARLMNLTDNNVLLMLLLMMIPAYIIFLSLFKRRISENVYPCALFLIGISLLLMYALRSNHILGSDTHVEGFEFLTTLDKLRWSQLGFGPFDACLSISLLPAIYQTFLGINPEFLFKLYSSLVVSILPLAVYLLSRKYIGSFYAFLASVFVMSQISFQWTSTSPRTNIAVLFFSLALLVMFHDSLSEPIKKALFIVFAVCTIMSHYGVTYAMFFLLLLTWTGMQILAGIIFRKKETLTVPAGNPTAGYPSTSPLPPQTYLQRGVTITIIALFLTMLFFWYSQMTGPSFYSGVQFIYHSLTGWEWLFVEEARSQPLQAAFGKTFPYTGIPQRIELIFSWLSIIFIAIGVLTTVKKFKAMVSSPHAEDEKPDFLLKRFEPEYLMLSLAASTILVATLIIPHISQYYGDQRSFFQMTVPLSMFFVIGGIVVSRYLKSPPYPVILLVLLTFFLCITGVVTQLFGFPRLHTLNSAGELYDKIYVTDAESNAAKWLGEYADERQTIHITPATEEKLLSQGRIPYTQTNYNLISKLIHREKIPGYIYLRRIDIENGLTVEYADTFADKLKIYANGRSEVYE